MRVGFLTSRETDNKRIWSGTIYHMRKALEEHCEVIDIGPVEIRWFASLYFIDRILKIVFGRSINFQWTTLFSYFKSIKLNTQLTGVDLDIIICPTGSDLPYLRKKCPIIYVKDASFSQLVEYYAFSKPFFDFRKKQVTRFDQLIYSKCDRVLFATDWALNYATNSLKVDSRRLKVVPFGSNIVHNYSQFGLAKKRYKKNRCNLIFIGVDWERKGGLIAYQTLLNLIQSGVEAELTICGCVPPKSVNQKYINVYPFLDKNNAEDMKTLVEEYTKAHFLLFPTRAECFGIVACEASAFGVPTLATDTGGVSGVVHHGINGYLLPYNDMGKGYASLIRQIMSDEKQYFDLCKSSRKLYEEKLNWGVWADAVKMEIKTLLQME